MLLIIALFRRLFDNQLCNISCQKKNKLWHPIVLITIFFSDLVFQMSEKKRVMSMDLGPKRRTNSFKFILFFLACCSVTEKVDAKLLISTEFTNLKFSSSNFLRACFSNLSHSATLSNFYCSAILSKLSCSALFSIFSCSVSAKYSLAANSSTLLK